MDKCNICGHPTRDGICTPKGFRIPKKLTDQEAARIVLPKLKTQYLRAEGGGFTETTREAMRNADGTPVVASYGDGRMRGVPKVWSINGDPVARYLEAMGLTSETADSRAINWDTWHEWSQHDPSKTS